MQETNYQLNLPCCIALLTDIHNSPCHEVIESLERNKPDIICIAGDIVKGNRRSTLANQNHSLELLRKIPEIAPSFLSIGNHEWPLSSEEFDTIRNLGVCVLDNAFTTIDVNSGGSTTPVNLCGLTSEITQSSRICRSRGEKYRPLDLTAGYNRLLDAFENLSGTKILLCHHPEYYDKYIKNRDIDLMLSGHAHGGQWRFFDRGIFAPGQGLLPKLTSGVHDNLVISRGLASTGGPIPRINNPTEIVYIR